ncbi:MAG: Mov34/MPN/PAD-1 family protein [Pseudomonadota bacterium]
MATPELPPTQLLEAVLERARAEPGQEICGLLVRDGEGGWHHWPVTNVHRSPERAFRMDPAEQIAAFRTLRERAWGLGAIYHSHPDGEAEPSETDAAEAAWETLHLILAPGAERPVRGWWWDGGRFTEVALPPPAGGSVAGG